MVSLGHIDLYAEQPPDQGLQRALTDMGFVVRLRALGQPASPSGDAQVSIVDAALEPALRQCKQLQDKSDGFIPLLFLTSDASTAAKLASLECGADAILVRPYEPAMLKAAVQALFRVKVRHDRLAQKAAEAQTMSQRLQAANQRIDMELELARRVQQSFLPQTLPSLAGVRFAVKYKPASRVGGDFYDITRLDETHLGFYVADAMGHGVPASLLTIFIKKGVKGKEIADKSYRLVPPTEVLYKLNRELIDQQIPDLPFITMVYVLFNSADGMLQFSRAGHPYPLYLPKGGKPVLWQIEGSLLGVFETKFRVQTHRLNPGDKVVFYTDGMDGAAFENHAVGLASLLAAAERFSTLPIEEIVDRLSTDLFTQTQQSDDLTVFGLEMTEASRAADAAG